MVSIAIGSALQPNDGSLNRHSLHPGSAYTQSMKPTMRFTHVSKIKIGRIENPHYVMQTRKTDLLMTVKRAKQTSLKMISSGIRITYIVE